MRYCATVGHNYLQVDSEAPSGGESVLWAEATFAPQGGRFRKLTLPQEPAAVGEDTSDCPGFQQQDGESADGASSMTSSDSGNAVIDMSDPHPMTDQQASEQGQR